MTPISSKFSSIFSTTARKVSAGFLEEIAKVIIKFTWNLMEPSNGNMEKQSQHTATSVSAIIMN